MLSKVLHLQYDSGSDITVIGKDEWSRLGSPHLVVGEIVEHAGGSELKMIGKFKCMIQVYDRETELDIHVADRIGTNLFGLDAIDKLDLWSVPLSKYQDPNTAAQLTMQASHKETIERSSVPREINHLDTSFLNPYQNKIFKSFPNLFSSELGICRNYQAKFNLINNAQAIQAPCRPIPYAMEKPLEEELQRLETKGIIERGILQLGNSYCYSKKT